MCLPWHHIIWNYNKTEKISLAPVQNPIFFFHVMSESNKIWTHNSQMEKNWKSPCSQFSCYWDLFLCPVWDIFQILASFLEGKHDPGRISLNSVSSSCHVFRIKCLVLTKVSRCFLLLFRWLFLKTIRHNTPSLTDPILIAKNISGHLF